MSRIIDIVINMAKDEVTMVRGINKELKRLEQKLNMIKVFLNDAQKKGANDNAVAIWLNKLRDIMYDADDIIDECETRAAKHMELQQKIGSAYSMVRCCYPSHLSCLQRIAFHHEIGNKIKGVNARLEYIFKEKSDLSLTPLISHEDSIVSRVNRVIPKTSPVYSEFDVVGIEKNVNILVDMLLDKNQPKNATFAITGMGGIGKTTLAQPIYNNERIQSEFDEKIWLCLSQNFSDVDLMKQFIRSARRSSGEAQECAELAPLVLESVKDKNFLLVLDDVWDAWFWVNTLQPALQRAPLVAES
ncbi:putative disease resistance protein RGA1 [Acorus gramineus]|uniref:Disease resistance protein RGA1 n=1 Tax=Acorus gramineus TaxID=55184 RepID=A0AAV8ZZH5_ACOGR|nr:putative disease resistance protein RGA1 [Acorus gramineus]